MPRDTTTGSRSAGVPGAGRAFAGVIASGCLLLLSLAAWMSPSADGYGTHTQLGLRECSWATMLDRPCPTGGMTTAFAFAAEGSFVASAAAQPFGLLLALGTAIAFWGSLHVALFGSALGHTASGLIRPSVLWIMGGAALAAWAYKFLTWSSA